MNKSIIYTVVGVIVVALVIWVGLSIAGGDDVVVDEVPITEEVVVE